MKYVLSIVIMLFFISCAGRQEEMDHQKIAAMARDFMKTDVIPHMKDPKPYEVSDAKVVVKKAADVIEEYAFTFRNLSFNAADLAANQRHLDSIKIRYPDPEEIVDITVNISYKTRYRRGNVVTDSVKLGYNPATNRISYWPF